MAGHERVDAGREEQPERRRGVEHGAGLHALVLGHGFGDERTARRPLAADAEARDDAADDQLFDAGDEGAERGADRVQHHGDEQHALAAVAVGDRPEQHAAHRPADEEDRGDEAGPVERGAARLGRADLEAEQRRDGVRRDIVEEQAVEDVEAPAEPGREQHDPLIAGQSQHRIPQWSRRRSSVAGIGLSAARRRSRRAAPVSHGARPPRNLRPTRRRGCRARS